MQAIFLAQAKMVGRRVGEELIDIPFAQGLERTETFRSKEKVIDIQIESAEPKDPWRR